MMTKKEMFEAIRNAVIDTPEFVEFLDKQIAALDRTKKPSKKEQEKQAANAALRTQILDLLTNGDAAVYTTKDIIEAIDPELSTQKVTAVIKPLIADGTVVADKNKGKRIYAAADRVAADTVESDDSPLDEAEAVEDVA